ncbi:MAG: SMP-30/gluconolactonase/LRE family protein [Acidobacteriota bacterium]
MKIRLLSLLLLLSGVCLSCSPKPEPPRSRPAGDGFVLQLDPALNEIVPSEAAIEKLADGFGFTEGPVWVKEGQVGLLFSDIPNNAIMKWTPDGLVETIRKPSGYAGLDAPPGAYIGSNGLTLDKEGRLVICEHGDRRVTRLEKDGTVTVLVDKFEGKRLNSPNDAVYRSDGSLYFTDPPYGLFDEAAKELDFQGVYRLTPDGQLQLLTRELSRPNGLAFSPDEKTLYVANSDPEKKLWMAFSVEADGSLARPRVFADVTKETEEGLPDGLKVDRNGNVYATGPGGVWVFSAQGKHLGTIKPIEVPANCHWGDADAKTLYMTARKGLYRMRLAVAGIRP